LSVPVGEVAWRELPCSLWGVAYSWRDSVSMLPPGCLNFNKVDSLHFKILKFQFEIFKIVSHMLSVMCDVSSFKKLGIVVFRPMTCLRHVNPTPIDFTQGFCIK
jgi:hypothetical protein